MSNTGDPTSRVTSAPTDYPAGPVAQSLPSSLLRRRGAARLITSGLLTAFGANSAQAAGTIEEHPILTKQTVAVEHVRLESAMSFAEVRAALERTVPHLDPSLVKALDEAAQFFAQNVSERNGVLTDDGNLAPPATKRGGDFQSDEARSDHHAVSPPLCLGDNGVAVREGPETKNMG